jgi:glycosyltransferase involved in cell wall biosynthesis
MPGILENIDRDDAAIPRGNDILFVGRLPVSHAQKRPDLLLRALPIVSRERPDAQLHFIGDGTGQLELKRIARELGIQDRVIFHGFVPEANLDPIFSRAGCLVLPSPSLSEGFGLVLIEALDRGVPVVLSNASGGSYVVERTGIGNLCRPNDVTSLADAITKTLEEHHQGKFDRLFDDARRLFSSSRMAKEYATLWEMSMREAGIAAS